MSNPSSATLLHSFLNWEKTQPGAVYMTQPYPDGRVVDYSWGQAADQARRVAAHLHSLKLPPKSNIAVLGKNSAHWIMSDLAIAMAGHVSVPLYPTLNGETAKYVLEHSGARFLMLGKMDGISDGWNDVKAVIPAGLPVIALPQAPSHQGRDVRAWDDLVARVAPLPEVPLPGPEELFTIIYTSGSTGRPKGVMHSFGSASAVRLLRGMYWKGPEDRMLSYLPLSHVAERANVEIASLMYGFRVYFSDSLESFAADLRRAKPTVFFSVPRLWTKFYQGVEAKLPPEQRALLASASPQAQGLKQAILAQLGFDQTHIAITGSAPLAPSIIEWYRNLGLELLDGYGMSEDFGYSHAGRPGEARIGYVGTPLPGVERRIADTGEIQIKSPGLMLGYYKLPEQTAEALTPDGWLKTGDRGEADERGRLRITGRVKELFKPSKGKYVAPVPIENKLNSHPAIEAVCVTGPGQPQPFALLMLSPDTQAALAKGTLGREGLTGELAQLRERVNDNLEDHEKLDYLVVVKAPWTMENGFLTPTMKIKRNVIEERYLPQADGWLQRKQPVIWE